MKVNCDFLPQEYKSFLLDTQALVLAAGLAAATVLACLWSLTTTSRDRASLTKETGAMMGSVAELENQLKNITYDQAAIQELITKFQFIQKAMGATDYPYLRLYQSLENALPRSSETGMKSLYISKLTREGEKLTVLGKARSRTDVTQFEKNLLASRTGPKQNFTDVKVLNTSSDAKSDEWDFDMQFTFLP